MHPRAPFHKSFRSTTLASNMGVGGCTMAARTRPSPNCSILGRLCLPILSKPSWRWYGFCGSVRERVGRDRHPSYAPDELRRTLPECTVPAGAASLGPPGVRGGRCLQRLVRRSSPRRGLRPETKPFCNGGVVFTNSAHGFQGRRSVQWNYG